MKMHACGVIARLPDHGSWREGTGDDCFIGAGGNESSCTNSHDFGACYVWDQLPCDSNLFGLVELEAQHGASASPSADILVSCFAGLSDFIVHRSCHDAR